MPEPHTPDYPELTPDERARVTPVAPSDAVEGTGYDELDADAQAEVDADVAAMLAADATGDRVGH